MTLNTEHQNSQPSSEDAMNAEAFLKNIDEEIQTLEQSEKERLNIQDDHKKHWRDLNPNEFTAAQREHTTILHAGLTMAHDIFLQSAFRGLGYKVEAMDVPDTKALQFGREFGNRGQCNPTYFTVGNLVKKLKQMEASGIDKKDIIENYLFATAGSCGPCRFGTYVTEYRKALRDAGFEGFRVILFQQTGGIKQATGEEMGLKIDANFFITMCKAGLLGDVINALSYRVRPYEINQGETDKVIARAKERICKAFETRKGLLKALWTTRKEFAAIKVDRTQIKPRVSIIGEFWAMTTEGDGNYRMQRFLEQEGAEVDVQMATSWGLYLLWAARYDTLERARLRGTDKRLDDEGQGSKFALEGINVTKKLWMIRGGDWFLRGMFYSFAKILGLRDYHLPDMNEIAEISHAFYDNNLRGGEGHMEVGKLIQNVTHQKVNMTLSIKPFGCMPSSSVSDGVQSLITELHPNAIFLPIETNGDGAVNVYSRVQMQLFKAKQAAEKSVKEVLDQQGWSFEEFQSRVRANPAFQSGSYRSPHAGGCTTLDLAQELVNRSRWNVFAKALKPFRAFFSSDKKAHLQAAKTAAQRSRQFSHDDMSAVKIIEP